MTWKGDTQVVLVCLHELDSEEFRFEWTEIAHAKREFRMLANGVLPDQDEIELADFCMVIDSKNGKVVGYGVRKGIPGFDQHLERWKLSKLEDESQDSSFVSVIRPFTKLKALQWIDSKQTLAEWAFSPKFAERLFSFVKGAYVLQILSLLTIVSCTNALIIMIYPDARSQDIDWMVYLIAGSSIWLWLVMNLTLVNYGLFTELLKNFSVWYMLFFGVMSSIGFADAFKDDWRRKYFCATIPSALAFFMVTTDAMHPSIRKRYKQVGMSMLAVNILLVVFSVSGYLRPEAFELPMNTDPTFSWRVGSNHLSSIYGVTMGFDWSLAVIIWNCRFIYNIFRYPEKLVLLQPTLGTKRLKRKQCIRLGAIIAQEKSQFKRRHEILCETKTTQGQTISLTLSSDDNGEIYVEPSVNGASHNKARKLPEKSILETLSGERKNTKTDLVARMPKRLAKLHKKTTGPRKERYYPFVLSGAFVEEVLVLDSLNTLGAYVFGSRVADIYHKFTKKTRWPFLAAAIAVPSFLVVMFGAFLHDGMDPDITTIVPEWLLFFGAWGMVLVTLNIMFKMNCNVFFHLLQNFETYFTLYIGISGFWPLVILVGGLGDIRGVNVFAASFPMLIHLAFSDAIQPRIRIQRNYQIISFTMTATSVVMTGLFWVHSEKLQDPLNPIVLLNMDVGIKVFSIDLVTLAMPKLIICIIVSLRNSLSLIIWPGVFRTLRIHTFVVTDTASISDAHAGGVGTSSVSSVVSSTVDRLAVRMSKVHPR